MSTVFRIATALGPIDCGPEEHADVFSATCGGMGLTGVILEAVLKLLPIETSAMVVDTERATDSRGLYGTLVRGT